MLITITGGAGIDNIDAGDGNDIIIVADDATLKHQVVLKLLMVVLVQIHYHLLKLLTVTLTAPEISQLIGIENITLGSNATSLNFGNETFTNLGLDTIIYNKYIQLTM